MKAAAAEAASARLEFLAVAIDSATGEMRSATAQVAEGSDAQRGVADQIAAAIHQFSRSIEAVAHSSSEALEMSAQARDLAMNGGQSGRASQEAMKQIQGTTSRILSAVQVIQEIARQTNLLSLNAAIDGESSEKLDPAVVGRDDACALGKWILGPDAPRGHASFDRMKERHAAFHTCAARILREAQGGRGAKAKEMIDSELNPATREVIRLLNAVAS